MLVIVRAAGWTKLIFVWVGWQDHVGFCVGLAGKAMSRQVGPQRELDLGHQRQLLLYVEQGLVVLQRQVQSSHHRHLGHHQKPDLHSVAAMYEKNRHHLLLEILEEVLLVQQGHQDHSNLNLELPQVILIKEDLANRLHPHLVELLMALV